MAELLKNEKILIKYSSVRLTGDFPESGKVVSSSYALDFAYDNGLDLILINENANPVVCKVLDYNKYLFEQKKHKKEQDKKQKELNKPIKEIQIGPHIASNDIEVKKKQIIDFLNQGHPVKVIMKFKRMELKHSDLGLLLLVKLADELSYIAKTDAVPKLVGDKIIVNFTKIIKK
jgi:translation initiation factor IF-3